MLSCWLGEAGPSATDQRRLKRAAADGCWSFPRGPTSISNLVRLLPRTPHAARVDGDFGPAPAPSPGVQQFQPSRWETVVTR